MKFCVVMSWMIACLILLPPAGASRQAAAEEAVDLSSSMVKEAGADALNSLIQKKLPFLSLSYADPDNDGDESGYILGYNWNKTWQNFKYVSGTKGKNAAADNYSAVLFAKGSHGLGDATNPTDMSEAGFSIAYHRAVFGKLTKVEPKGTEAQVAKCVAEISEDLSDAAYNKKVDECSQKYGVTQMFEENHRNQTQWALGGDAHAKVEGDEDFDQKHYVFGLGLIGSMNPAAKTFLSYINILDWPFCLTRKAIGGADNFTPYWPVVRVGIESVNVDDDDPRYEVVQDDDSFARIYGEIAFTTNVCDIQGKTVKFNTGYLYYGEIDSDDRVSAAGLDEFGLFSVSLQIPVSLVTDKVSDRNLFFIRYTNGDLPFDRKSSQSYELGWTSSLNIAGLFSDEK